MTALSTIPHVLSELLTRFTQRISDVKVTDGVPKPPEDIEPDLLCIGFTGEHGEPSVEDTRTSSEISRTPERESYDITCLASSWRGNNTDAELVRNSAFAIVDKVASELANDHTLGGLVLLARMRTSSLAQEQTNMGAVATIRFVIHIDAFTRNIHGR